MIPKAAPAGVVRARSAAPLPPAGRAGAAGGFSITELERKVDEADKELSRFLEKAGAKEDPEYQALMTIGGAVAETNFEVAKLKLANEKAAAKVLADTKRAVPGVSQATLQAVADAVAINCAQLHASQLQATAQAYAQAGCDAGAASAFGAFIRVLRKRHAEDSVLDLVKQGCATDPVFAYAVQHWKKRYVQTKQPSTVAPPAARPMPPHKASGRYSQTGKYALVLKARR